MKFKIIISIFVLITNGLLCDTQTTAEDFSLKLIQNILNVTRDNQNFAIAPYEAYNLYHEIFPQQDSNESDEEENSNEIHEEESAVIRQQMLVASHKKYNTSLPDLLSTISLKARWSFNFQSRDTHKQTFHQLGSKDHKMYRDFLRKDDIFHYTHDEQLNASILELPLNLNKIKLMIILPDEWDTLPELRDYLTENIEVVDNLIKRNYSQTLCRVSLPKFHVSYKMNLKDFYEEISLQDVTSANHIYQMTNLEFNERGIGKFEKTTVLFWNVYSYLRISPVVFDINHPFLFLVTDKDGIQFFGQVVRMHS